MKTNYIVIILGIIITSSIIFAISFEFPFEKEYYEINITGLKDVYRVGEPYSFSYTISGYGYSCGDREITYPDENGDTMTMATSASCIAGVSMKEFVFDIQKEQGTTYGHIKLKNPGTYTVTVTFDRSSQDSPTTASKELRVIEK